MLCEFRHRGERDMRILVLVRVEKREERGGKKKKRDPKYFFCKSADLWTCLFFWSPPSTPIEPSHSR